MSNGNVAKRRTRNTASRSRSKSRPTIVAVDLFCGAGGLTAGLAKAGVDVRLGVDIDPACEYPYTANNDADFLLKSVVKLSPEDIDVGNDRSLKLLAGCAPCQPFSTYHQKATSADRRWNLLNHFGRLAEESEPDLITMENVPNLAKQKVFKRFVNRLKKQGFHVSHEVVDCSEFGVPQTRRRLVLLASKLGPITLKRNKRRVRTVKQAISKLPRLKAGQVCKRDRLHQAPKTRALFWSDKFSQNVARDARKTRQLRKLGWRVITIWECQCKDVKKLEQRLDRTLGESGSKAMNKGFRKKKFS